MRPTKSRDPPELTMPFLTQAAAGRQHVVDALEAVRAELLRVLAGEFAARKLGMRTMIASDIREHFSEAIRSLDPRGE